MWALRRPPQIARSLALIALGLVFLPLNIYILLSCYALQILSPFARSRREKLRHPKKVLISGVNNAIGLALARNLYVRGHHVVGVDYEKYHLQGIGRRSNAIRRFYSIPGQSEKLGIADYMHGLLEVVKKEKPEMFISCSSFTSPLEDAVTKSVIEKLTDCKCIALDSETAAQLSSPESFVDLVQSTGLFAPEIHSVTSRDQIHKLLGPSKSKERTFTISKARSKSNRVDASGNTLLPRRSVSQTYQFISQLPISKDDPYVLEEHVTGEEYCTFVLTIGGVIEAFVACLEPRSNYIESLELDSPLYHALLRMTKLLTTKLPEDFSGALTFSFRVQMSLTTTGFEKRLVPRACIPKVGLPSLLLESSLRHKGAQSHLPNGYLDASISSQGKRNVYWASTDYLSLILYPTYDFFRGRISLHKLWTSFGEFFEHILFWREATFVLWDPLPFFWQYAIYWPARLALALLHREKWNHLDVTNNELRYDG